MSETYKCKKCERELPVRDFYRDSAMASGHLSFCKECVRMRVTKHRNANLERVRAYDRNRADLPHRVASRKEYAKAHSTAVSAAAWARANPAKKAAHTAVNNAVRDGRLIRPKACDDCGRAGRIHGHHDDYSGPLDVRWLCAPCHGAAHRALNEFRRAGLVHPMPMAAE